MTRSAPEDQCVIADLTQALLKDEPALLSSLDFGPFVRQGTGLKPNLLIGDTSEISLSAAHVSHLEYRMALLAEPGDHALVRQRHPGFEAYLASHLNLGKVTFHEVDAKAGHGVCKSAYRTEQIVETLGCVARRSGGMTVLPYLTTGHSWRLAQAIGERAGHAVHVSGPSPRISRRANDKLWFASLVRRVISRNATPPTLFAFGPAATAGLVRRISRIASQVIVKIPDSAGSAGNLRLDSTIIQDHPLADLRRFLLGRLHAMGWRDTYPVLVGVWDSNVTCSPSVQLWLPLASEGAPIVEGIFEQRVQTEAATFVGAARSALPQEIKDRLGAQALRISAVLQRLGYFGRCSLDAVLCDRGARPPDIHWIECNGRWGGVSIPLCVGQRQSRGASDPSIAILQEHLPDRYLRLDALLKRLDGLLLDRVRPTDGLVVLSPPEHPSGTLLNLLALSGTQSEADALLGRAVQRLTDHGPTL